MDDIKLGLDLNEEEAFSKIEEFLKKLETVDDRVKKIEDSFGDTFEEAVAGLGGLNDEFDEAAGKMEKAAKENDKLTESNAKQAKSFKDLVKEQKIFGVSINDIQAKYDGYKSKLKETTTALFAQGKATKAAATNTTVGAKAIGVFTKGLRIMKLAILATGIGAFVIAFGALVTFLTKTQRGIEIMERVSAALGATWDVLIDNAAALGETIFDAFSDPQQALKDFGNLLKDNIINRFEGILEVGGAVGKVLKSIFTGDLQALKKAALDAGGAVTQIFTGLDGEQRANIANGLKGITKEINEEAAAAVKLQAAIQAVEREQIKQIVTSAKLRAEIKQNNLIAEDVTASLEDREKAANKAFAATTTLLNQETSLLKRRGDILEAQQALGNNTIEDDRELAQLRASQFAKQQEIFQLQTRLQTKLNAIKAAALKIQQDELKRQEELTKAYEETRDAVLAASQQATVDGLSGEAQIQKQRAIADAEIDELERVARERAKAAGETFDLEEDFELLRLSVARKASEAILELREKEKTEAEKLVDEKYKSELEGIKLSQDIDEREAALATTSTDKLLSLEQSRQKAILEIRRDALNEQIELARETYGEDSEEFKLLRIQIKEINAELGNIGKGVEGENPLTRIIKSFGLNDSEIESLRQSFASIYGTITDQILESTQAEISAQQSIIDATKKRIEETTKLLDEARSEQDEGRANDVDLLEKKLKDEEELLRQADNKKRDLEKKALKQKLAIEAASQAASLASAIASIFAANAGIPFVGIALAVAAAASLVGLFRSYQTQVSALTSDVELREGLNPFQENKKGRRASKGRGLTIRGPSHDGGGVPLLHGDTWYEAEGDEILMGTKASRRHSKFLWEVNKGDYDRIDLSQMAKDNIRYMDNRSQGTRALKVAHLQSTSNRDFEGMKQAHKEALSETNPQIIGAIKSTTSITKIDENNIYVVEKNEKGDVVFRGVRQIRAA